MSNSEERKSEHDEMLCNLEVMKTLRPKTSQLETIKAQVLIEIEAFVKETNLLQETRRELTALQKERTVHVQAIATIDQDIAQLEQFLTSSQHEQETIREKTMDLFESSYKPLKEEVDTTRNTIGLDSLPELTEINGIFE